MCERYTTRCSESRGKPINSFWEAQLHPAGLRHRFGGFFRTRICTHTCQTCFYKLFCTRNPLFAPGSDLDYGWRKARIEASLRVLELCFWGLDGRTFAVSSTLLPVYGLD
jgi:hypothetical protein